MSREEILYTAKFVVSCLLMGWIVYVGLMFYRVFKHDTLADAFKIDGPPKKRPPFYIDTKNVYFVDTYPHHRNPRYGFHQLPPIHPAHKPPRETSLAEEAAFGRDNTKSAGSDEGVGISDTAAALPAGTETHTATPSSASAGQ